MRTAWEIADAMEAELADMPPFLTETIREAAELLRQQGEAIEMLVESQGGS
jgi:hypothetical protein